MTVHDYGIEAGTRAFLVMELLEGATLREELRARRRLDARRVVEIFRGLCSAVEAAHARQLIHRDLKPENIYLARGAGDTGETVKVLDFGIAKFLPGSTEPAEMPNASRDGYRRPRGHTRLPLARTTARRGAGRVVGPVGACASPPTNR